MNKTFDQGKDEITKLCRYFETNRQAFLAPGVKEAHVRQSLIDPLFEALGWDVRNTARIAPQYREVVPEDSLEVEGRLKAPDYSFRVGATAKFYAEAKKCGVNISTDPAPAYQLRCYGWSAKAALSILTDFEELSVYDCTLRPRPTDRASRARILYLRFDEYPDRWREIWDIFSREAVWGGSFDRFAGSKRGKRGSSEVDVEFLKEIEGWRDELARNIALRNKNLSSDDLNAAVQRTIDRVVFLRMAEDRGIEPYEELLKLCERPDIYARFMREMCRKADEKYNSGLFHFQKEPGVTEAPDTITPRLDVDDKVFKPILQSLYFSHGSPYHFGVLPVEILGTVYERFLGKVIRLTSGHQAKIEEKPEVRKAGGVYYTPAYIVDYIVRNTVGKMIEGKSPKELRGQGRSRNLQPFRVLDMACGSGSFLLGAYQCLLDHYLKWYTENDPSKHKGAVWEVGGETQGGKKQALRHVGQREKTGLAWQRDGSATQDLFSTLAAQPSFAGGTDASLVAQTFSAGDAFSSLVAQPASGGMIVRESAVKWRTRSRQPRGADATPDSRPEWRLTIPEKKRILTTHIFGVDIDPQAVEVAKLSLLLKVLEGEDDPSLSRQLELFHVRALPNLADNVKCGNSLIGPDYFTGQMILDPEEMKRVNAFEWNAEFPEAMKAGGFDCLIGNPPWISLSGKFRNEVYPQQAIQYLTDRYQGNTYMPNMYEYFVAQGLSLTRDQGYFGYVVPDRLGFNSQFVQLRKRILKEARVISLTYKVPFPGITADTLVFVFQKGEADHKHIVSIAEYGKAEIQKAQSEITAKPDHPFEYFVDTQTMRLVSEIESSTFSAPLQRFCESTSGFGGKSELILEVQTNKKQIPTIKGSSVGRYEMRKTYWFDFRKENITGRTTDKSKLGASPKILLRKTGDRIIATYDESGLFPEQSLYFLYNKHADVDYKYLLGILNSRLLTFYYKARSLTNKKSIAQVKKVDLDKLPIHPVNLSDPTDKSRHARMVMLVNSMLTLHKHLAATKSEAQKNVIQRQIAATDREIDQLVYDLYGLTKEEIAIVEGRNV